MISFSKENLSPDEVCTDLPAMSTLSTVVFSLKSMPASRAHVSSVFWKQHGSRCSCGPPWSAYQLCSCFSPPPPTQVLKPGSLGAPALGTLELQCSALQQRVSRQAAHPQGRGRPCSAWASRRRPPACIKRFQRCRLLVAGTSACIQLLNQHSNAPPQRRGLPARPSCHHASQIPVPHSLRPVLRPAPCTCSPRLPSRALC